LLRKIGTFGSDGNLFPSSIDDDGNYSLEAPHGKYNVAVLAAKVPGEKKGQPETEYEPPEPVIETVFNDTATSGLEVEVMSGAPPGHYDLKLGVKK
jgi:hypothetical protein